MDEKLEIDEVLTLKISGMPVHEIMNCDLDRFEHMLESNPDLNNFLNNANDGNYFLIDNNLAQPI